MRVHLLCVFMTASAATLAAGCDLGGAADFSCLFHGDLSDFDNPTRTGHSSTLASLCTDSTCTKARPLAVGADHTIQVALNTKAVGALGPGDKLSLEVSPEGAVQLAGVHEVDEMRSLEDEDGRCSSRRVVRFDAELVAAAPGHASVRLLKNGELLDSYGLLVEAIAHTSVGRPDRPDVDLAQRGLDVDLHGNPYGPVVEAHATSADGRELVLGPRNVDWEVDDPNVVQAWNPGEYGSVANGPAATFPPQAVGTTTVHYVIGQASGSFLVRVFDGPVPPDAIQVDAGADAGGGDAGGGDAGDANAGDANAGDANAGGAGKAR